MFPVSPNIFSLYFAILQLGLWGMRVEEGARRIVASLSALKGDLQGFQESFDLLGRHLTHAMRNLEEARSKLERFDWKLGQVEVGEESGAAAEPR